MKNRPLGNFFSFESFAGLERVYISLYLFWDKVKVDKAKSDTQLKLRKLSQTLSKSFDHLETLN